MDSKTENGRAFQTTYYVRGRTYSTNTILIPSKFTKTIAVITPLMKFGGEVALLLLDSSTPGVRVVLLTQRCIDVESLRSQLPAYKRCRLIARECEFHSPISIKMAVLWLRMMLGKVHVVVHLEPIRESPDTDDIPVGLKALLCANSYSVEQFRNEMNYYFGKYEHYVQLAFPLTEKPAIVAYKVLEECARQNVS